MCGINRQSEADFYYTSLTGTGIDGTDRIDGSGPHYSSDYRLSKLEALTYGVRVAWEPIYDMTLDLQWERYEMNGLNSQTPTSFFPSRTCSLAWSTVPLLIKR